MSTLTLEHEPLAVDLTVTSETLTLVLADGAECDVIMEIVPSEGDGLRVLDAIWRLRVAWDRVE